MLRAVLGVSSAVLLAIGLTSYGGAGASLLSIATDRETPGNLIFLYSVLGVFGVAIAAAMLCLAFLLFAEFLHKKRHFTNILRVVIVPLLLVLSLAHIAAYLGLGKIQNTELVKFVDGFVLYAVLALGALALFVLVHRMNPHKSSMGSDPEVSGR